MRGQQVVLQDRLPSGFSLIELMIVLAIAVVLLGIGVPSFRTLIQNQRMTTTVNDFFTAINLTRSEAIKRGERVDLVPAAEGNDWTKGWVVLLDKNGNQRPDTGEEIIFSHGPVHDGITVEPNLADMKVQYVAYNGTGRAPAGSFLFRQDGEVKRKISINFLGRPRVCNPATDGKSCNI